MSNDLNGAIGGAFGRLTKKGFEIVDDYRFAGSAETDADFSVDFPPAIRTFVRKALPKKISDYIFNEGSDYSTFGTDFRKSTYKFSQKYLNSAINFDAGGVSARDRGIKGLRDIEKYGDSIEKL